MEYIISDSEKKVQRNPFYQLWRFSCLSLRFMKLSCACCRLPPAERAADQPPHHTGANNGGNSAATT
jgi:hypothetical protein